MQGIVLSVVLILLAILLFRQYMVILSVEKETEYYEKYLKEKARNESLKYALEHPKCEINLEVRGFEK